jgi:hypothetical protein
MFLLPALLLLLAFAAPGAVAAATCPTDASGVLEKSTYQIGERIDFFGTFTDFGDPGTVTIRFDRPADGATRTYTAQNVADGSWFRNVVFRSRRDAGSWRVHIVVDQTSGRSTCDDRFTLTAGSSARPAPTLPNTSTDGQVSKGDPPALPIAVVAVGLIAFGAILARSARGRPRSNLAHLP